MNIGLSIDCYPLIVRQHLCPALPEVMEGPVIPIKPTPKDRSAISVNKLLAANTVLVLVAFHIPDANRIVAFPLDGHGIAPNNVQRPVRIAS